MASGAATAGSKSSRVHEVEAGLGSHGLDSGHGTSRAAQPAAEPESIGATCAVDLSGTIAGDILLLLDSARVKALKAKFEAYEDGLALHQFVQVMRTLLDTARKEPSGGDSRILSLGDSELVANLCELFSQIDINGDGSMEWEEFSSYIVERGMLSIDGSTNTFQATYSQSPFADHLLRTNSTLRLRYLPGVDSVGAVEVGSQTLRLYKRDGRIHREYRDAHSAEIQCFEHIPSLGQIVLCTNNSRMLCFDDGNHETGSSTVSGASETQSARLRDSIHRSGGMHHPPRRPPRRVVTVSMPLRSFAAPSPQLAVAWSPEQKLLYSGGVDGAVYAWDPTTMEEVHAMRPYTHSSGAIASSNYSYIPNTRRVIGPGCTLGGGAGASASASAGASSGLLWATSSESSGRRMSHLLAAATVHSSNMEAGLGVRPGLPPKRHVSLLGTSDLSVLPHGLQRPAGAMYAAAVTDVLPIPDLDVIGSASMDAIVRLWDAGTGRVRAELQGHAKACKSLAYLASNKILASTGFDHQAFVWNPFLRRVVAKLEGHRAPLVRVIALDSAQQLITGDSSGLIKIWDVRMYGCVQTLFAEEIEGDLGDFACIPQSGRIVGGGRRMVSFACSSVEHPEVADDVNTSICCYNPTSCTFITAAGRNVKVWDAQTGGLLRVHTGLAPSHISSMCLDDRERKFILGMHNGSIQVFDYENGAPMKRLHLHGGEVTALQYSDPDKMVLSVGWDRNLVLSDEQDADKGEAVKQVENAHNADITCAALCPVLGYVVTGDGSGVINVWDYEFFRHIQTILGHTTSTTSLALATPYPVLVSADAIGNVCFWSLKNPKLGCPLVCRFLNTVGVGVGLTTAAKKKVQVFEEQKIRGICLPKRDGRSRRRSSRLSSHGSLPPFPAGPDRSKRRSSLRSVERFLSAEPSPTQHVRLGGILTDSAGSQPGGSPPQALPEGPARSFEPEIPTRAPSLPSTSDSENKTTPHPAMPSGEGRRSLTPVIGGSSSLPLGDPAGGNLEGRHRRSGIVYSGPIRFGGSSHQSSRRPSMVLTGTGSVMDHSVPYLEYTGVYDSDVDEGYRQQAVQELAGSDSSWDGARSGGQSPHADRGLESVPGPSDAGEAPADGAPHVSKGYLQTSGLRPESNAGENGLRASAAKCSVVSLAFHIKWNHSCKCPRVSNVVQPGHPAISDSAVPGTGALSEVAQRARDYSRKIAMTEQSTDLADPSGLRMEGNDSLPASSPSAKLSEPPSPVDKPTASSGNPHSGPGPGVQPGDSGGRSGLCAEQLLECFGLCQRQVMCMRLIMGDDAGNIKVLELLPMFRDMFSLGIRPARKPRSRAYPRRQVHAVHHDLDSDLIIAHRSAVHRSVPFFSTAAPVFPASVPLSHLFSSWKAHSESVGSVQAVPRPRSIISCSHDRAVRIWSHAGMPLGSLRQGNTVPFTVADHSWKFQPDTESRRLGLIRVAKDAIEQATTEPSRSYHATPVKKPAGKKGWRGRKGSHTPVRLVGMDKWGGGSTARRMFDPSFWEDDTASITAADLGSNHAGRGTPASEASSITRSDTPLSLLSDRMGRTPPLMPLSPPRSPARMPRSSPAVQSAHRSPRRSSGLSPTREDTTARAPGSHQRRRSSPRQVSRPPVMRRIRPQASPIQVRRPTKFAERRSPKTVGIAPQPERVSGSGRAHLLSGDSGSLASDAGFNRLIP